MAAGTRTAPPPMSARPVHREKRTPDAILFPVDNIQAISKGGRASFFIVLREYSSFSPHEQMIRCRVDISS